MATNNQIVTATVNKVSRTFLFCSFEKTQIFIHATEISDKRITGLDDFFSAGQKIKVKLLSFDPSLGRWTGSYKSATDQNVTERAEPLPTAGGSKRLLELTLQSAEKIHDKKQ